MKSLKAGGYVLTNISNLNILLGKNGCGKSHLLKSVEKELRSTANEGLVRYISPERAGYAVYEPGIEHNMAQNPAWMDQVRRNNQSDNFKQQSVTLYRRLETMALREIDNDRSLPKFSDTIDKINLLLDRVKIVPEGSVFRIIDRETGNETTAQQISSGESELLSLSIEMLAFLKECKKERENYLFIDEPDVHLHPDLQYRFAKFVVHTFRTANVVVFIATHSTALLSALAEEEGARVSFMKRGDQSLKFEEITLAYRNILPIFGAHPLSNVFNQFPILLVEGEDDERVWQKAIRSANGKLKVYPCVVDGLPRMAEYEHDANNIIESIYDNAKGYSIRDRDVASEAIENVGHIVRMRLSCRAAENLMLCDDSLALVGQDWEQVKASISQWLSSNANHKFHEEMKQFSDDGSIRKDADLKEIRNILIGLITNKPWEVLVGQAIAQLVKDGGCQKEGSLRDYLGNKICTEILGIAAE